MKKTFKDFHESWCFLEGHPAFEERLSKTFAIGNFQKALSIFVPKVNPKSRRICNDKRKNTKTEVWLECGGWMTAEECGLKETKDFLGAFGHDIRLDCGADTFEQAIIKLANLVLKEYGDYPKEDL